MTRRERIEAFAARVALAPIRARKGVGKGRMSAAKRDRLAGLAMLIERQVPRTYTRDQRIVHVQRYLIEEIRKELEEVE